MKMEETQLYKYTYILRMILLYTFLSFVAITVIVPFYWMILTALKSQASMELIPPELITFNLRWKNFADAFDVAPFGTYFKNTLIVAFVSTLGTVITTVLSAFAFSRLVFKGRDMLFTLLLTTMMIPGEMLVITNFVTVSQLGWINTFAALTIPFMTSIFYIFFLRQTFKQIPDELYYAAKVDGTSDFKYLWKVMIPIGSPTIITITILNAIGSWNAYVWPNLVANDPNMRLVTNGLRTAFTTDFGVQFNLQMAASAIITLPLLVVFLLLKKYIIRGVSRSGIKG
jgi:multiple sugar transport system permease protein